MTVPAVIKSHLAEILTAPPPTRNTVPRSLDAVVLVTDVSGKVTFLNGVAERLTGWSWAEAVGRDFEKVFDIADDPGATPDGRLIDRVLRAGATTGRDEAGIALPADTILRRRDGSQSFVGGRMTPVRDELGERLGVVLVFHQNPDHRPQAGAIEPAAGELRASGERYDALAHAAAARGLGESPRRLDHLLQ